MVIAVALAARIRDDNQSTRVRPADTPTHVPFGEEPVVAYPDELVAKASEMVNVQFAEDPIRYRETDESPVIYTSKADMARMLVADMARRRGLPYRRADLLAPLTDESGKIVGYEALNVSRLLTVPEVSARDFDLCAIQVAQAEQSDRVPLTDGLVPQGSPRERLGC